MVRTGMERSAVFVMPVYRIYVNQVEGMQMDIHAYPGTKAPFDTVGVKMNLVYTDCSVRSFSAGLAPRQTMITCMRIRNGQKNHIFWMETDS